MKALFIADAHLKDPADENYRRLLAFLRRNRKDLKALFFLGDIFAFWSGPRFADFPPFRPLLEEVKNLRAAGVAITWVEGNHDFHLAPFFSDVLGCRVLSDGGPAEFDGRRLFLAHGDLVNPEDKRYLRLRRLLRRGPGRTASLHLPPALLWRLARLGWALSRRTHAAKATRWSPEELLRHHSGGYFQDGFDAVVTGHYHVPLLENRNGRVLVALGDWIDQYSYAVLEDGRFELKAATHFDSL